MLSDKKGIELSLNTVIIAIIVLIVLGLLVFLVLNQVGVFREGTSCLGKGGTCIDQDKNCDNPINGQNLCGDDPDNVQVCCKIG